MRIQYVQQLSFENCATLAELGEQLARPAEMARLGEWNETIYDVKVFQRVVSALLTDNDHEFILDDAEWKATYAAWCAACERRKG